MPIVPYMNFCTVIFQFFSALVQLLYNAINISRYCTINAQQDAKKTKKKTVVVVICSLNCMITS